MSVASEPSSRSHATIASAQATIVEATILRLAAIRRMVGEGRRGGFGDVHGSNRAGIPHEPFAVTPTDQSVPSSSFALYTETC